MIENVVTVQDLLNQLNYEQLTGDNKAFMLSIIVPDTYPPSLELTGYYLHSQRELCVLLGNKQMGYIHRMSHEA